MQLLKTIIAGKIARWFIAAFLIGFVLSQTVPDQELIQIFNLLVMSVSFGVAVAYSPLAAKSFTAREPSRADVLAFGTFMVHSGICSLRLISLFVRSGEMIWLRDSDLITLTLFFIFVGGICNFNAHEIVSGAIPNRQWRLIGIMLASVLFIVAMLINFGILVKG